MCIDISRYASITTYQALQNIFTVIRTEFAYMFTNGFIKYSWNMSCRLYIEMVAGW